MKNRCTIENNSFLIFYISKQFTVQCFSVAKYRVDVSLRIAKSERAKWYIFLNLNLLIGFKKKIKESFKNSVQLNKNLQYK